MGNLISPNFLIGMVPIYGDVVLAPMDGLSDSPLRQICRDFGSAMSISEFVNAYNFINHHPRREKQLPFASIERPFAYQIFDNNIERIVATAEFLLKYQPDFIDINMGCSNRAVSGRGAGAGLMREPKKAAALMNQMVKTLPVPVTAKLRLGWDETEINYLEIARCLEEEGCACLTLHARTRAQQYSGKANWDAIAQLVQAVKIPVIGNGDIVHPSQIDEMLSYTQCAAVMIGRGALGNPWIFDRQSKERFGIPNRLPVIQNHLSKMIDYYGSMHGAMLFRKHIKYYLNDTDLPASFYQQAYGISTGEELACYLQDTLSLMNFTDHS